MNGFTEDRWSGGFVHGVGAGLRHRRFSQQEVQALVREIHTTHAGEEFRMPYESVRSMLGELGFEPARLESAIRSLDARRAAARPARGGGAALATAAAVALGLGLLLASPWFGEWSDPRGVAASEVTRPNRGAAGKQPTAPPASPQASASQIRELQEQSFLSGDLDGYRLALHNPLPRGVKRLLVRINAVASGRQLTQRFCFAPLDAVGSLQSDELWVRHALPEAPVIRSWKIEAADLAPVADPSETH
jgi:hypothetical protein